MQSSSVGIIGGADGPTQIFVAGNLPMTLIVAGVIVIAAIAIFSVIRSHNK